MKQRTRLSNGSAEVPDSALPQLQAQPAVVYGQQGAIKPKTHVWDGRLLDQQAESTLQAMRKNGSLRETEHPQAAGVKFSGTKFGSTGGGHGAQTRPPHGAASDAPPMTPPHVSGISFAPVQDSGADGATDTGAATTAAANFGGRRASQCAGQAADAKQLTRRPALIRTHAGAQPAQSTTGSNQHGFASQQEAGAQLLVAEGRALQGLRVGLPPGAQLAEVAPPGSPDLITTYFHEIHGLRQSADSSCGTPPTLNLEAIHRDFDANLPLGPLSPSPLSPSMLTLCSGLDVLQMRPPTGYLEQDDSSSSDVGIACRRGGSGRSDGEPYRKALPDMRMCESPVLRHSETPANLPE